MSGTPGPRGPNRFSVCANSGLPFWLRNRACMAPRLECLGIAAGGNLADAFCPGSQTSMSYVFAAANPMFARAQGYDAIRQLEAL